MKNISGKRTVFLASLFSLIICLCFTFLTGCFNKESPEQITTVSDIPSEEITLPPIITTPDTGSVTEDDPVTPEVTTTEEPTDTSTDPMTPAETTTQTPVTTVLPAEIATEGIFKMDTGSSLDFKVAWKLDRFEDGYAYIDVDIVLNTYEIYVSQRRNLGVVSYGEEKINFSTDRISYSGKNKIEIPLTKVQIAIPTTGDIAVAFVEGKWFYNGNYAGVDYDWLSAGGYVCVKKP